MDQNTQYHMFLFLLGTSLLNFAIAAMIRVKTHHKEFNTLLLYWPCIILTFIAAGALNHNPTEIAFAYFFQIFSSNLIVKMMCSAQGSKINWPFYIGFQVVTMVVCSYLLLTDSASFTVAVFPVCLAFSLPFVRPIWYSLVSNRNNSSWIEKAMGMVFLTGIINHFNYAFFRLDPEAAFWGWSISIAQYQCLSLFLPLLINYRREQNERKNLLSTLEKLSGNNPQTRMETVEIYRNLEIEIAQKELFFNELQSANFHLAEEREMNEVLIRTISHDLANPLTVIAAYIDMLYSGKIPQEESDKIWMRLKVNTQSALDMISRIRNAILTRTQASLVAVHNVAIDRSFDHLIEMFDARLKEKNIALNYHNSVSLDSFMLAEENALVEHVFANILSNAIKFSYPSSAIDITISEEADGIRVEFKDHGQGIQKSRLEKPLLTSTNGTSGETGTGFGLMIMGYFLRQFGATMEIDSKTEGPSKGTSVVVHLKKSKINHSLPLNRSPNANISC